MWRALILLPTVGVFLWFTRTWILWLLNSRLSSGFTLILTSVVSEIGMFTLISWSSLLRAIISIAQFNEINTNNNINIVNCLISYVRQLTVTKMLSDAWNKANKQGDSDWGSLKNIITAGSTERKKNEGHFICFFPSVKLHEFHISHKKIVSRSLTLLRYLDYG